jgi:hypothetical protein
MTSNNFDKSFHHKSFLYFHYFLFIIILLKSHCLIVSLSHCLIVSLSHCLIVSLSHCTSDQSSRIYIDSFDSWPHCVLSVGSESMDLSYSLLFSI